jgi:hypothetical protein
MKRPLFLLLSLLLLSAAVGAEPPSMESRLAAMGSAVRSAQSAGDNAWMLVSAALVLIMTGPGLALFYGGLVRKKNVLGTMMHSFILMAVVTVPWALVGYSLTFGEGSALLHDLARAISLAGCNIEVVLVDTKAHKALDVFYVTSNGAKLTPQAAIETTGATAGGVP